MDNIFLSHSYILVFPPKSLFSITLTLICITLSFVTLLGNNFSFHFIALSYKRNVILLFLSPPPIVFHSPKDDVNSKYCIAIMLVNFEPKITL